MMNALTLADLDISQDLDRDALAIVSAAPAGILGVTGYSYGAWSGYYNGDVEGELLRQLRQRPSCKSRYEYTRSRVQYEVSLWDWFY